jgi:hypothetical protein
MEGQTIVAALIVASAIAFVTRRVWRAVSAARAPKSGCGSDCGCGH